MASHVYVPVPTPGLLKIAHGLQENLQKQQPGTCLGTRRNNALEGRAKGMNRLFRGCLKGIGSSDTIYVVIHGTGLSGMEVVGGDRNADSEEASASPTRRNNLMRPLAALADLKDEGPTAAFKKYTAGALAKVMQQEGLPKSHRLIELLACGAGLIDNPADRQREIADKGTHMRSHFSEEIAAAQPKNQAALAARLETRVASGVASLVKRHQAMDARPSLKVAFGERFYDALVALGYAGIRVRAYTGDIKAVSTALEGRLAQPFSIETSRAVHHPDAANMRVIYGEARVVHG